MITAEPVTLTSKRLWIEPRESGEQGLENFVEISGGLGATKFSTQNTIQQRSRRCWSNAPMVESTTPSNALAIWFDVRHSGKDATRDGGINNQGDCRHDRTRLARIRHRRNKGAYPSVWLHGKLPERRNTTGYFHHPQHGVERDQSGFWTDAQRRKDPLCCALLSSRI